MCKPRLRGGPHPPRNDPDSRFENPRVVHPLLEKRIVNLLHPSPGPLLDPFDRGFGGQSTVDRLVDPP